MLKSVQRALREAFLALPPEEYDWLDVYSLKSGPRRNGREGATEPPMAVPSAGRATAEAGPDSTDDPESEAGKYARGRLALPEMLAQFEYFRDNITPLNVDAAEKLATTWSRVKSR